MIDEIEKKQEKLEDLLNSISEAPDLLESVDNKMDRIEVLEEEVSNMLDDVENTMNNKLEDLTMKLLMMELKAYGAVFFVLLAGGFYLNQIGQETWGTISHSLSFFIIISVIITLYRYLGNDFLVDLFKIINPFVEKPQLEKGYTVGDKSHSISRKNRKKLKQRADRLGFDSIDEYLDYKY